MYDSPAFVVAISLIGLALIGYKRQQRKPVSAPLPPGPAGLPLIGNVTDLPKSHPWMTFAKWGERYGGIVHINALGNPIIVLNDIQYAIDMLDKKSRIYSDRPKLMMAGKLVGWDAGPALIPFGQTWGEYRRLLSQFLGTKAKVEAFDDVLQGETDDFLKRIAANPESWRDHARKFAGAVVLRITYGYKPLGVDDKMVQLVDKAMDQFSETVASNAFLVDVFPMLQHVPSWFPGASWKKKVPIYSRTLQEMLDAPFNWVKEQMAAGTARPCFVSNLSEREQFIGGKETVLKWAAAGIYSGGADTTVAGIACFFLAMTLEGVAQKKAQAELDAVIGTERLPTLADRARLPYVEALFMEVMRTYIFGPLGLPHVTSEDDIHDGYFIPKGSMIITNVWQFCRDPKSYANPELFSPERFIASDGHPQEADPRDFIFGFGRRSCPGFHLADATMWLACVSALAAFDITPPVRDGKPVLPSGEFTDSTICHPEPFDCVIKPRSEVAAALIHAA